MKRKWIETGQNILIILLNHLVIISFGVTAMGLLRQEEHWVWLWSLLLVIPLFFAWAKIKIRNFFLFFALHLSVPIGSIFLPLPIMPRLLVVIIGIIYFIWSVRIGIIKGGTGEGLLKPVFMTVSLGVMLFIETSYSQKGWECIYITLGIIYAAGYIVYLFTSRYLRFLIVNESSVAYIPEKEIFNKGFCQSFMYMAGVVTLLALTANVEWLSYIVSCIGSLIGKFFIWIFKLIFSGGGSTEEEVAAPMFEEMKAPDIEMLPQAGEPALFWVITAEIARIAVVLFIVGMVVFGVIKGFQCLWKGFHRTTKKTEKEDNSIIDIRESCAIEKSGNLGSNWFAFLNNREKIRKIYRKQVLKNRKAIIRDLDAEYLEYMTAKECCEQFAAEPLKKVYEKARYSEEEIVASDVKAAKSSGR